ncbi:HlyD family efflux transporter periplasmic adaptor subunit [Pseudomonas sp. CCM 7893]|uniref:HlyD family efflux transporter periplasmic adaptor subunit n=1 Tax=Pseudomonas spelaei TaxID=1055469 RepID=A0A6I3W871_9PSED|nr:efflux RND transporter periplasmic adaptor subunit [Pseudomonas spelaei]MUF03529.1 HlyD family efflux transporter periplasmic adaptor subunit [Pseudomonas spelaei]QLG92596.1 efflux RND transporter periplasmic adaptor subunit [Pseudomonas yamanorum]
MATAETNNTSQQPADTSNPGKRRFMLLVLALIVILGALGVWGWYEFYGRWGESTDDAYVNGNVVEITPLVTGTVVSIGADDGDLVHEGQVLINFDPNDAAVGLQSAQANLARTVRQVRGLYSNVDGMKAQVNAQRAEVQTAQDNYNRRKNLAQGGAISLEELSHARDSLTSANNALANLEQQLKTTNALVDDTVISSHPDVQAAAAQLRQAYLTNARSTLIAPVTGYVAKRTVQLGQRVQPGTALMAVIPLDQLWIDANFKETQLRQMRIGQPVEIEADIYGSDVKFSGSIDSLGAGTGSAFALLPAQNATGNWIKIVQRVPVRIHINAEELAKNPLRVGLSTVVNVNLHDQSGPVLAQQAPQKASFSTNVYDRQLAEADAMITQLIHDNSLAAPKAVQR